MSRLFYHVMQDNAGNLLFDVSGTMRLAGTGTLATIYGDEAMTIPIANPMTNHPSYGSFKCYLAPGDYDFYMAKAGYTFETLTGIQGFGTMVDQNAAFVQVTGGELIGLTRVGIGTLATEVPLTVVGGGQIDALGVGGLITAPFALSVNNAAYVTSVVSIGTVSAAHALNVVGSAAKTGGGAWSDISSSMTLKQAIAPLTGALEVLMRLRPRVWRWRDEQEALERMLPGPQVGFVIEEVAEDLPQWCTAGTDGTPALTTRGDIAYLVAAVQELAAQVERLTARLAVFEDAPGV